MKDFATVKLNSTGTDVYTCQVLLRAMGFRDGKGNPVDVTGVCTKDTVHAINSFQSYARDCGVECGSNGLNDGMFGKKCWTFILGL